MTGGEHGNSGSSSSSGRSGGIIGSSGRSSSNDCCSCINMYTHAHATLNNHNQHNTQHTSYRSISYQHISFITSYQYISTHPNPKSNITTQYNIKIILPIYNYNHILAYQYIVSSILSS